MRGDSSHNTWQLWPRYLACYVLWLAFAALGAWLIVPLRAILFNLAVRLRFNPWVVRAVDEFGVVTLGLLWLVSIIVLEYYLRRGVLKRQLWGRAVRVAGLEIALLGLVYGLQALLA